MSSGLDVLKTCIGSSMILQWSDMTDYRILKMKKMLQSFLIIPPSNDILLLERYFDAILGQAPILRIFRLCRLKLRYEMFGVNELKLLMDSWKRLGKVRSSANSSQTELKRLPTTNQLKWRRYGLPNQSFWLSVMTSSKPTILLEKIDDTSSISSTIF